MHPAIKLSKETLSILKNFSTINNSVLFKPGTVQRTVAPQKTILAKAEFKEAMPMEFAIYDLAQFLSVLSLCQDPSIECHDKHLVVKDASSSTTYYYASPTNMTVPPAKEVTLPSVDAEFVLEESALQAVLKAAAVLSLPEILLFSRDGQAFIGAADTRTPSTNLFEHAVGSAPANFRLVFKAENFKMLADKYTVKISQKGLAYFKGTVYPLEYWIPVSTASK